MSSGGEAARHWQRMAVEETGHVGARECERAQERGEEVRWWPGVLGVLFRELG
jgi:hypothetical protein